jgi:hypothetical protein
MKKFIFRIVIFGIWLLLLAFVVDIVISKNLRKSQFPEFSRWNDIYSGEIQSDVVIMGNSRAAGCYSPQILDSILGMNFYNLGMGGSAINRQILFYDTYRRFNKKPICIIQNIDIGTIAITKGYEREQFFPYFFDDSLKTAISSFENFNVWEQYIPYFRYIGYHNEIQTGLLYAKLKGQTLSKGYLGRNAKWNGSRIPKTEIIYTQDTTALLLFDKYLSKAKSENIKVIFVYAPFHIRAVQKVKNVTGMFLMFDSIAKKYDIPILNYTYDSLSYDTVYFWNAMHLNKTGAEFFSVKLAHDIDSLGIMKENF